MQDLCLRLRLGRKMGGRPSSPESMAESISASPALMWGTWASRCLSEALCSQSPTRTPGTGFRFLRKDGSKVPHQRVGSQLTWQDKGSKAPASPGFSVFPRSSLCICTTPWMSTSTPAFSDWSDLTFLPWEHSKISQEGCSHSSFPWWAFDTGVITVRLGRSDLVGTKK